MRLDQAALRAIMRATKVFCGDTILSMNEFWNFFQTLLGLSLQPKDLTFVQISLRGITVFLATLIMVRLGSKRFDGAQNSVRCHSAGDSRFGTFMRHQRFRAFPRHNRWRRGFSGAPPPLCTAGVSLAFVRNSGQRETRRDRPRWSMRFPLMRRKPYLNPRSGGRHAPQRSPRRGCTSSTRMP